MAIPDPPAVPAEALPDVPVADELQTKLADVATLLETLARNRNLLSATDAETRQRITTAAGDIFCPDVGARRLLTKAIVKRRDAEMLERDEAVLAETGIRQLRRKPVFTTPNYLPPAPPTGADVLDRAADDPRHVVERNCYTCKRHYSELHHFYDQLCPECAALNMRKRTELADLRGRVALLTGGRVKIGYQAGIKLLRAGASLIVTTRFPRDSAARYAAEPDFEQWGDRLEIYGLDLRHAPSVEGFCAHLLRTRRRLDFIVNNACQTVRRPPAFYEHMMAGEAAALSSLPQHARTLLGDYEGLRGTHVLAGTALAPAAGDGAMTGVTHAASLSQIALLPEDLAAGETLFPGGRLDQDLQQIDLRDRNSWRLQLDEVAAVELLEVQLVNAVAPFLLNARLKPLLMATPERDKHIVNVSAVEGQFYRRFKTTRHPHTNMAKAALNMMTRTSAADYHADGIHMNSVDTGWVTDEDPVEIAARKTAEHRFHPPLDIVDGAARIVDPIISGFNTGTHVWGQFLKDYVPTHW